MTIGREQRAALTEIVAILAPCSDRAQLSLARALDDTSKVPTPAEALSDALEGTLENDIGRVMAGFDWKAEALEIRESLSTLATFPQGFSWEWYDWSELDDEDDDLWDPDDRNDFLRSLGRHSFELGFALIGLDGADWFSLGFVKAEKFQRLQDVARKARTSLNPCY
ncbi:hypothetical protein AB0M45_33725 [Nocardia sp. NPDC051787]|uniref:DUF6630 family protein n=1 Tax=Nocardia sp. NPDC051787 TaxID=3155415 RepID=UPI00343DD769